VLSPLNVAHDKPDCCPDVFSDDLTFGLCASRRFINTQLLEMSDRFLWHAAGAISFPQPPLHQGNRSI